VASANINNASASQRVEDFREERALGSGGIRSDSSHLVVECNTFAAELLMP
jgi:hypothetical protein